MTKQQGKALIIIGGLVVGSYVVRSLVISSMQMSYMRQQQAARARQQAQAKAKQKTAPPKKTEEKPKPKAAVPPPPKPKPPAPSPYAGVWTGRTAIDGRGICTLRLEITDKQAEPNHFTGFSSMVCNHAGPLVARGPANRKAQALNMDPEAAVLTGTLEKTSVELTSEKTIGTDPEGCAPTGFSLTLFGKGQLAVEWKEATCSGGHMILRKGRR